MSILENTYRNIEVICIDDGSRDNTVGVIESIDDSRVRLITQENAGVSAARNKGLDIATGEFVCFIDGDDWVHTNYFSTLVSVSRKYDADITMCYIQRTYSSSYETTSITTEEASISTYIDIIQSNESFRLYVTNKLFKREILSNTYFDSSLRIAEDRYYNDTLLLKAHSSKCAIINERMYFYFLREGSGVHTFSADNLLLASSKICQLSLRTDNISLKRFYWKDSMTAALSARYLFSFSPFREETEKACKQLFSRITTDKNYNTLKPTERLKWKILLYFPFVYRLIRIILDPTMLQWEKEEKKKWANS